MRLIRKTTEPRCLVNKATATAILEYENFLFAIQYLGLSFPADEFKQQPSLEIPCRWRSFAAVPRRGDPPCCRPEKTSRRPAISRICQRGCRPGQAARSGGGGLRRMPGGWKMTYCLSGVPDPGSRVGLAPQRHRSSRRPEPCIVPPGRWKRRRYSAPGRFP